MHIIARDKMALDAITKAARSLGYEKLTTEQNKAIVHFVNGQDVFISLPTGAGKSLCYILLPVVFDILHSCSGQSMVVVVSPLKSLMQDQVTKYSSKGIKCAYINGDNQCKKVREDILSGKYQVVFISPELMLAEGPWREMFRSDVYQKIL